VFGFINELLIKVLFPRGRDESSSFLIN